MLDVIESSFKINLLFLKTCGMYTTTNATITYKLRAFVFYLIFIVPLPVLSVLHILIDDNLDMETLMYDIPLYIQLICCCFKLTLFLLNEGRITKCLEFMNINQLPLLTEDQKNLLLGASQLCRRNTFAFLSVCSSGVFGWFINPLIIRRDEKRLPSEIWLPFDVKSQLSIFWTVYALMTIAVLTFGTGMIDPLMAGLAHHATCHIKILNEHLKHLDGFNEEVYDKILHLAKYHNVILDFVRQIESCFSWVFFSQMSVSAFIICLICFQMTEVKSFNYFVFQLVSYFLVVTSEVTFYCYYGNELTTESEKIINSVYMSKWYTYNIKCRKSLIIIMQRSQKPLILTAGKIVDLSLVTLATILQRSYSLLAVLQNQNH